MANAEFGNPRQPDNVSWLLISTMRTPNIETIWSEFILPCPVMSGYNDTGRVHKVSK